MKVVGEYSFAGGQEVVTNRFGAQLKEIYKCIEDIDFEKFKTKNSKQVGIMKIIIPKSASILMSIPSKIITKKKVNEILLLLSSNINKVIPNIPKPIINIAVIVNVGDKIKTGKINTIATRPTHFAILFLFTFMIFIIANRIIKFDVNNMSPYIETSIEKFW